MISRAVSTIPRSRKGVGAFTLIELALVAVIILALVSLSTPLFRRTISDLSMRDASFNISKLINYAQEHAVLNSKKTFKIKFDIEKGRYQLVEFYKDNLTDKTIEARVAGRFGKLYALPRDIMFKSTDSAAKKEKIEVIFYPDGHCTKARIDLYDSRKNHYAITTKGFGGLVEVNEVKGER